MDGVPQDQQGPPSADAAKAESRLAGHIGYLTKEEEASFEAFKKLCAKEGLYKPATQDSKASLDDGTLVRYLRARKFVPQDAFVQFKDTELWRKENNLDALYEKIEIEDYWESRGVYPQWTGRRDKRGIPVYLYEVGKLNSKKMLAYTSSTSKSKAKGPSPTRMLRLFALYENLTRFVMPLCSAVPGRPNPETPVDQSNNIVDISKVGLKQFWNLRSHMQDASQLATAHYPETLDRIFIIGAPSFFPTVWGWIKKWFDPITTSKIFILSSHQVLPTLSSFIDIANIPKKYGGELDFECGQMPNLDPQIRRYLGMASEPDSEKLFLTSPVRWIDAGDDGEMVALSVGSINGKEHKEQVCTLHSLAVRVATHSSNFQSQRTEKISLPSRPATSDRDLPHPTYAATSSEAAAPLPEQADAPLEKAAPSTQSTYIQPPLNSVPHPTSSHQQHIPPNADAPPLQAPINQPAPITPQTTSSIQEQSLPVNTAPEHTLQNGGPPGKIAMPPPPAQIERTQTEYVTPASDPSELKTLQ